MTRVLIATDSPYVAEHVKSVLPPDTETVLVDNGPEVRKQVLRQAPDIAVLDFQIANMGGMAICMDLRLEESGGRIPFVPVLLLLDRRPDVFLARRASAQGWLIKPLDPIRTRRAIKALLDGGEFHDATQQPSPVAVAPSAT